MAVLNRNASTNKARQRNSERRSISGAPIGGKDPAINNVRFQPQWGELCSPEELLEKLAVLVPIPRVHLIRYPGCLAPHAKLRKKVVPAREAPETAKPSRKRMTWAQLLKRVFKIEIDLCRPCGGSLKVIATIVKPDVIEGILKHLGLPSQPPQIL